MVYKDIIFECKSEEDIVLSLKIGKKYGWERNDSSENIIYYIIFSINIIFNIKIMFTERNPISLDYMINNLRICNHGDYKIPKSLSELDFLLSGRKSINYNEPKKLIYD